MARRGERGVDMATLVILRSMLPPAARPDGDRRQ